MPIHRVSLAIVLFVYRVKSLLHSLSLFESSYAAVYREVPVSARLVYKRSGGKTKTCTLGILLRV